MNLQNIASVGCVTFITDVDGRVHGFGPNAQFIMTPRETVFETKEAELLRDHNRKWSTVERLDDPDTEGAYYIKSRLGGYKHYVPNPVYDGMYGNEPKNIGTQVDQGVWEAILAPQRESDMVSIREGLAALRAEFSEDACFCQLVQPLHTQSEIRQFWAVLSA